MFPCHSGAPSRRSLSVVLSLVLAGAATSSFAQSGHSPGAATADTSTAPADQASTLDAITVIAHRPGQGVHVVTDPHVPVQPVPASDGADYLKSIPGFNAIRNGGSNGDPVLRGMFGSRLSILGNDGAMPGACPARMDNPLSYVSPETYDRLVVVKGPQTVRWGPTGSAGTIRFEREIPRFTDAGGELRASLLGGSFGRNDQLLDATAGTSVGHARVSANRSQADDYNDGAGNAVPSRWYKWNADFALGWTPDADTELELRHGSGDGQARYAGRGMDGAHFRRDSDSLLFRKRQSDGVLSGVEASLYRNAANHLMDNYSLRVPNPDSAMPMPMASQVYRQTRGGRVALDWTVAGIKLTTGVDSQRSAHRERSAMGRGQYQRQPWQHDARFRNDGLFAEAEVDLEGDGQVFAGARLDRARVRDLRAMDGGMTPVSNPTAGVQRREDLGSGFLRWEHGMQRHHGWGGYIGLGHSGRMPDYWELFSATIGPTGSVNAFSAVKPERTTQLDGGLQWRSQDMDAWLSVYAGRVSDYILFRYRGNGMMGPMSQAANVDADIGGGEAGLTWRPAQDWTLESSLAYAWGRNRDDRRALPQQPPLEGRLGLAWDNKRWSAGGLLRVVQHQKRIAIGDGNVVGRDLGSSAGFAVLSLNAGYRIGNRMQLTAGIDNLFDRDYAEHLNLAGSADFGYPSMPVRIHEPGRNLWLKFGMEL